MMDRKYHNKAFIQKRTHVQIFDNDTVSFIGKELKIYLMVLFVTWFLHQYLGQKKIGTARNTYLGQIFNKNLTLFQLMWVAFKIRFFKQGYVLQLFFSIVMSALRLLKLKFRKFNAGIILRMLKIWNKEKKQDG